MPGTEKLCNWLQGRKILKELNEDAFHRYGYDRLITQLFGGFKHLLIQCSSKIDNKLILNVLNDVKRCNDNYMNNDNDQENPNKESMTMNTYDDNNENNDNNSPLILDSLPSMILKTVTNWLSFEDIHRLKHVSVSWGLVCLQELKYVDIMIINGDKWILNDGISYDIHGEFTVMEKMRLNGEMLLGKYMNNNSYYAFMAWNKYCNTAFPICGMEASAIEGKLKDIKCGLFYITKKCEYYYNFKTDNQSESSLIDAGLIIQDILPLKYFDLKTQKYYILCYLNCERLSKSKLFNFIKHTLFIKYNKLFEWFNHEDIDESSLYYYVEKGTKPQDIHPLWSLGNNDLYKKTWGDCIIFEIKDQYFGWNTLNMLLSKKKEFNDKLQPFFYCVHQYLDWKQTTYRSFQMFSQIA